MTAYLCDEVRVSDGRYWVNSQPEIILFVQNPQTQNGSKISDKQLDSLLHSLINESYNTLPLLEVEDLYHPIEIDNIYHKAIVATKTTFLVQKDNALVDLISKTNGDLRLTVRKTGNYQRVVNYLKQAFETR